MNQVSKLGNYLFQLLLVLVVTWKLGSFPAWELLGNSIVSKLGNSCALIEVFNSCCVVNSTSTLGGRARRSRAHRIKCRVHN